MPPENLGFLEAINTYLPYVGMVIVAIVAAVIFIWYTKKYTPEIARTLTTAYHRRGLPAFIQDEMGNVRLYIADKKLPEGVIHIKTKGWFLLPNPPNPEDEYNNLPTTEKERKKPGPKPKEPQTDENTENTDSEQEPKPRTLADMSEAEKQDWIRTHGILVQTPILAGFGKQVFFGSTVSAPLSKLLSYIYTIQAFLSSPTYWANKSNR